MQFFVGDDKYLFGNIIVGQLGDKVFVCFMNVEMFLQCNKIGMYVLDDCIVVEVRGCLMGGVELNGRYV